MISSIKLTQIIDLRTCIKIILKDNIFSVLSNTNRQELFLYREH